MSARALRRSDFPALDQFLAGYLNQDVHELYGSVEGAVDAFLADARPRRQRAVATEWETFLTLTEGRPAADRLALFVRSFGAGWAPRRFSHLRAVFDRIAPPPR